jgi:hypothetical protein
LRPQSFPAGEDPSSEMTDQQEDAAPVPVLKAGPKLHKLEEYTAGLLSGLEPHQAEYIYKIRQEFGVIRSVQVIRSDIEAAVKSCGERNPDLQEEITARFQNWNDQILPKLAVADVALKDAIQRQNFRPTVRVTMLLDHVQAAFEERDAKLNKVPVTTHEACKSLMDSMDLTEKQLKDLMDQTTTELKAMSADPEKTAAVDTEDKDVSDSAE